MQSAFARSDIVEEKSRPRPFGLGRLTNWAIEQSVPLLDAPATPHSIDDDLVRGGLDPVIAWRCADEIEMTLGQVARFAINLSDRIVRLVEAHPDADRATIEHLLDDHVAPRIIAADGTLVLHGSATLIGSRAVIFLGLTGSGKSTLAASLHAAGYPLLGDDAVVIADEGGSIMGEAVYPSLRLYRESIEEVLSGDLPTASMAVYSDKRHVRLPGLGEVAAGRYPIGGIYLLVQGESGVALDPYSPSEGCMALLENSFALDPTDGQMAALRMGFAASVAARVPCYELAYPYDFGLLDEVGAKVVASLEQSPPPA